MKKTAKRNITPPALAQISKRMVESMEYVESCNKEKRGASLRYIHQHSINALFKRELIERSSPKISMRSKKYGIWLTVKGKHVLTALK